MPDSQHGVNYHVYLTVRQNVFTFILIEILGLWSEVIYLLIMLK